MVNRACRQMVLLSLFAVLAACGGTAGGAATSEDAPVTIVDHARDVGQTNDFLRLLFVPSGVKPTSLGLPSALRIFLTASDLFRPPMPLGAVTNYPGLVNRDDQDLVALRCTPSDPAKVEPTLATWPNVFAKMQSDFAAQYTCPPQAGVPENDLYCLVKDYADNPNATVAVSLQQALTLGATLFADASRADALRRRYGIYPAFSGLGYAVKGSGSGTPMGAGEALQRSVAPEYLLKNASLADAGCFCLIVPPYNGRSADPLDVDFVAQRGGFGECMSTNRLANAQR